ncbi:MAG: hypothetical protein QOC55_1412 [Thermoleophilaceae bacterium]|nr:hypothetical protein [Thermoleophilaceae bacterium]
MASHAFGRPRVLVLILLIAALALAAVLIGFRASGGTESAKATCPSGYIPAEKEIADRYAQSQKKGEADKPAESEQQREADQGGGGIEHSSKYCIKASHPEMPDDIQKFGEAAGLRMGGEAPGQQRAAIRQKAHLADSTSISGANGTWQPLGQGPLVANDPAYPYTYGDGFGVLGGRISDYAYDASTNRLWATVAQGGVWESTDRGDNWFVVSDGQNGLPVQSSGGIAWTPAGGDGGTLVVLTGDHAFSNDYAGMGAYYTTDDGRTWHHARGIPDGALSFQIAVDPTNPKRLYAATGVGLFRSDDAGRSFQNVNLPTGDCAGDSFKANCFFANIVTSVQVQAADKLGHKGGAVAAAVGWRAGIKNNFAGKPQAPNNGIYVSDSGNSGSFQKVADGSGITPTDEFGRAELGAAQGGGQNSGYLYAIVQNSKYFREGTDVGDLGPVSPPGCDPLIGAVCPNSGSVIDGIYSSSDFGKTWKVMEDHNQLANDVTSGSSLTQLRPLGISAGYQTTYNEWIKVDPTQQDANGVPTHLLFGMEEIWQNGIPGQAMDGQTKFQVIAPYNQAGACLLVLLAKPCGTTQSANPQGYTTHPDQHGAIILPAKTGLDLIAGDDGGNYVQHSDSGTFSRNWGAGNDAGFHTLLPYGVAMAKDRTVYAGLQDNGEMRIDPKTGVQNEVYGGDGVFTLVNPDNSNEAIEEYPGATISVTSDGGKNWSDMSPIVDDPDFVTPLVQDPADYKHVVTGGRQIMETTDWINTTTNCHTDPGGASKDPTCPDSPTDWKPVFDLGTHAHPGDPKATAGADDPANHVVALRTRGANSYAGFCGSCDPVKLNQQFHNGIATNVGGSKPPKIGTPDGWHVAAAKGLPNRIITGLEIDPGDAKTVYVTLGSSAARPFAPLGSQGEDPGNVAGGYVYVSHDAGENFTDISGDLPKIQATWVRVKGNQLVISDAIGMFISNDRSGKSWAPLGSGFPTSPVYSFEFEPADPSKVVVASYGRGVWEYDFNARKGAAVLNQSIAGGKRPNCGDHAGPTSRFLANLKKAVKRNGKGVILSGTSAYKKCKGGAAGKVKRVSVLLKLQVTSKKCRYLTPKGTLGKATSCKKKKLAFFTAKGTTKWTYKVKGPLPAGKYVGLVIARDNIGNTERQSAHRNFRHFRLRGRAVIAGWNGKQSNKVPPPGHKD